MISPIFGSSAIKTQSEDGPINAKEENGFHINDWVWYLNKEKRKVKAIVISVLENGKYEIEFEEYNVPNMTVSVESISKRGRYEEVNKKVKHNLDIQQSEFILDEDHEDVDFQFGKRMPTSSRKQSSGQLHNKSLYISNVVIIQYKSWIYI